MGRSITGQKGRDTKDAPPHPATWGLGAEPLAPPPHQAAPVVGTGSLRTLVIWPRSLRLQNRENRRWAALLKREEQTQTLTPG